MMNKEQRQFIRKIEAFTQRPPKEMPEADFWVKVLDLVKHAETCATEAEKACALQKDRNLEIEATIGDQLVEVRAENLVVRKRAKEVAEALGVAVEIAKKDRPAGWKKAGNPDFRAICECESVQADQ